MPATSSSPRRLLSWPRRLLQPGGGARIHDVSSIVWAGPGPANCSTGSTPAGRHGRRLRPCIAAVAVLLACTLAAAPAAAHESEQYSLPLGRDFADLGPHLSKIVHGAIVDAASRTNDEVADAIDNGASPRRIAALQSAGYLAGKVWEYLFAAIPANELLDLALASPPLRARYPGLVTMYRPPASIYDDPLLVVDITKAVRTFFRAGSISAGGVVFGTDKLIHFINVGRIYHVQFEAEVSRGESEQAAGRAAVYSTLLNPFTSEDGLLGMLSTGIYSNGDLAANYAGLLFYRNLSAPVPIGTRTLPPILERDGAGWRVVARPDSDFFTAFVTPHWNEVLNPNSYAGYVMDRLQVLLAERCADAVDWYRDPQGRRRTQAQFEMIESGLATYFGADYGHRANRGRKVTIASVCFAEGREEQGSIADDLGRSALWWAARNGDLERVRQLLSADVDAADVDGETPLHAAVRSGDAAVVSELIARGADPDRDALYGVTPLLLAASRGRTEIGETLLRAGADPNRRDHFGRTALHAAATRGDLQLAQALLRRGAQPQLADDGGATAPQLAARGQKDAMARLLRSAGGVPAGPAGSGVASWSGGSKSTKEQEDDFDDRH
jgi:ankyrin repeat protein